MQMNEDGLIVDEWSLTYLNGTLCLHFWLYHMASPNQSQVQMPVTSQYDIL